MINKINLYDNTFFFFYTAPRQCTVCGKLAEFECKECYGECGEGLESIAFCLKCLKIVMSIFSNTIFILISWYVNYIIIF